MHINSVNGTSFKGLLVIKSYDKNYEYACNTEQVVDIRNMGTKNRPHILIGLTKGEPIPVALPFDEVVQAYQRAASTSSYEIKSEN